MDLSALEARHGGRIGLFAEGPVGRVQWRAGERFAYCSTFKLFLAACVLDRVQKGQERLDRPVLVAASDMVMHGPVTEPAIGSTLTIETLCKAIVEVSDNPAANILFREMGGLETLQAWYRSIKDDVTRVDRYETALNSADPGDLRDTTTPEQFAANLAVVMDEGLLSPDHLALLTRWLIETPTGSGRIKAGVPAGYRVAHKTGTGAHNTHNNIAVIQTPSGGSIRMVVYYTEAQDASPEQVDQVVAEATRQSMQALGHGGAIGAQA
ncbi:MAG: class A beta-lactamase [Caulobacter sp.]